MVEPPPPVGQRLLVVTLGAVVALTLLSLTRMVVSRWGLPEWVEVGGAAAAAIAGAYVAIRVGRR